MSMEQRRRPVTPEDVSACAARSAEQLRSGLDQWIARRNTDAGGAACRVSPMVDAGGARVVIDVPAGLAYLLAAYFTQPGWTAAPVHRLAGGQVPWRVWLAGNPTPERELFDPDEAARVTVELTLGGHDVYVGPAVGGGNVYWRGGHWTPRTRHDLVPDVLARWAALRRESAAQVERR